MGYDPEHPTRRIPPQPPQPPSGYAAHEREYIAADPAVAAWQQEVRDRLRSLQTAVALIGVLAAIGLGVAVWALVKANDASSTSGGVSSQRVTRLENRVDDIESRLADRATKGEVSSLRGDVRSLQDEVKKLSSSSTTSSGDVQKTLTDLKNEVDQLNQRVDGLASQQGGTATGTTTTP